MKRTLWLVLIVALASAPVFGQYQQSPYLDGMDLPPVEERIPVDPLVIAPGTYGMTEIGLYGGIFAIQAGDAPNAQGMTNVAIPFWGEAKMERPEALPLGFKSVEASNGNRSFTIKLRTGLRWSDGEPYTTEDYLFWWEDYAQNPELSATVPAWLVQGDAVAEITAIDDVTLRIEFANPYPGFQTSFGANQERQAMAMAKHYLSQFHKDYADATELASKVEAGGFEDWIQLYQARRDVMVQSNPDAPSMVPWVASTASKRRRSSGRATRTTGRWTPRGISSRTWTSSTRRSSRTPRPAICRSLPEGSQRQASRCPRWRSTSRLPTRVTSS